MTRPFAVFVLAAALLPSAAAAQRIETPDVPGNITAPAGTTPFLSAHAIGTQNYICLPSAAGVGWTLFGPQATLFDEDGEQVLTHFLSPNPVEGGTLRATWQHSRTSDAVWAFAIETSSDARYVAPGAIPWLLLRVAGQTDPANNGAKRLPQAVNIQRIHTAGGVAPAIGCASPADIGRRSFVPYEADYVFYREGKGRGES